MLNLWAIRTLDAFDFIQEFELMPVVAFGNRLIVIGLPEPAYWIAQNDNEVNK